MGPEVAHHNLLFDVRRSVRYHNRRRAFYDRMNASNTALSLVFGSAAAASALGEQSLLAVAFGLIVTVGSSLDLVIGSAQKARLHYDLARRFIDLEKQLIANPEPEPAALLCMQQERLSIEADEPPVLRVLDCLCHNELVKAMGYDEKHLTKVTGTQRFFAQFFDVDVDRC